jgi:hypothetical protein
MRAELHGRVFRSRRDAAEYRAILETRLRHLVPVDQPLVLVSQIERSGGSLLMRLFDGHPELHAVPHELGRMSTGLKKQLDDPAVAWESLTSLQQRTRFVEGFRNTKTRVHGDDDRFSFLLPPRLQRAIFESRLAGIDSPERRQVVDAYMTSYFNGWLDNRNLRGAVPKRWVTGFEPSAMLTARQRDAFRAVYPDGRAISIVRDPVGWYASARIWKARLWRDRDDAVTGWMRAAEALLEWREELGDDLLVLTFADLLGRTEQTMSGVAAWLGIELMPSLLEPTFNGLPIKANSSFAGAKTGISSEPLARGRSELTAEDEEYILDRAGELYRRVTAVALQTEPAAAST